MFGFIKSLFSNKTNEALEIVKGVGGFIDEQFLSEQEKKEFNLKRLDYYLKWLESTNGMNLSRRLIALGFCFTFLLSFWISLMSLIIGFYFGFDYEKLITRIIELVTAYGIDTITLFVVGFYFGKGIVSNFVGGKLDRSKIK
jgi:hypothetical protein